MQIFLLSFSVLSEIIRGILGGTVFFHGHITLTFLQNRRQLALSFCSLRKNMFNYSVAFSTEKQNIALNFW